MAKYPKGRRRTVSPKPKGKRSGLEDPSCYLLRTLLAARPDYVSGSVLADRLKMTRVAVWGRIDKLRSQGLEIEAARNRGYRLEAEPDHFNQHLLEAWLREKGVVCPIFCIRFSGTVQTPKLSGNSPEAEKNPLPLSPVLRKKVVADWDGNGTVPRQGTFTFP